MAVQDGSQSAEREWDGRLLDCCGNCDPNGVSTFAYVKYCTPLAWGHNMKRAFNASFWKHAILFALLFGAWWWLYIGFASQAGLVCGPEPPPERLGHHHWGFNEPWSEGEVQEGFSNTEDQTFLAGATWQPEKFEPLPTDEPVLDLAEPEGDSYDELFQKSEDAAATAKESLDSLTENTEQVAEDAQVKAEQQLKQAQETAEQAAKIAKEKAEQAVKEAQEQLSKTTNLPEASDELNAQVQWAKQQVADGMAQLNAQLGVGRKLLHKHHDEDDDEDDKDHDKKAKKHKEKKDKKKKKKCDKKKKDKEEHREGPRHPEEEPHHHPEDGHHHGPPPEFGPDSPACRAAQKSVLIMWGIALLTAVFGVHYAARMRTAIRERFGIPGSRMKDCLAWLFCGPCALCQETRTLALNNVHSGIWFGPTMLAVPSHPLQAPEQQAAEKPGKVADETAVSV